MPTIELPNPVRLRAVRQAIRLRAATAHASTTDTRHALATALREMQQGHSAATAVALAIKPFRAARRTPETPA
jgi:hypothetical protein